MIKSDGLERLILLKNDNPVLQREEEVTGWTALIMYGTSNNALTRIVSHIRSPACRTATAYGQRLRVPSEARSASTWPSPLYFAWYCEHFNQNSFIRPNLGIGSIPYLRCAAFIPWRTHSRGAGRWRNWWVGGLLPRQLRKFKWDCNTEIPRYGAS